MRPLVVTIAALALFGAGCVSVEVIKKETPPVQEQAVPFATTTPDVATTTTGSVASPSDSNTTTTVNGTATSTTPEPVSAADVTFVDNALQIQAIAESDGIKMVWTPMTDGKLEGYKVVRSASDPLPWYPKSGAIAFLVNGTDASYVDRDVQKGTAYWYRICAVVTDAPVTCGNVVKMQLP